MPTMKILATQATPHNTCPRDNSFAWSKPWLHPVYHYIGNATHAHAYTHKLQLENLLLFLPSHFTSVTCWPMPDKCSSMPKCVPTSAHRCSMWVPTCAHGWPSVCKQVHINAQSVYRRGPDLPLFRDYLTVRLLPKDIFFGVLTAGVFSCHIALLSTHQMQVTAFISFQHPDLGSKLLFLVIFHFLLVFFVICKELS